MNMISKIKEAAIDVGPQPVKYAKFSTITYATMKKLFNKEQSDVLLGMRA